MKLDLIKTILMGVVGAFSFHTLFYFIIGLFKTREFPPAKQFHKYALLIPARNEEKVIGNLINSIKRQDYPAEYLTVFVVADNCTDSTAERARELGAVCYEHVNPDERTKGFALKYLFECIDRDYGIEAFEGYFVFDSDNLLNRDYISRMNDSFDAGEKIITSYRNTKNFDENWIASTYAIHWLRSVRYRHRARAFLRLATNIQGTGFLFSNELVKDGWKYTSLTEDRAFTADAVAHGYEISFNNDAIFFDEQPVSVKIAIRQRIRWAKGHLQAFAESGPMLFKNIFLGQKKSKEDKKDDGRLHGIRYRWAAFDTLGQLMPENVIKLAIWILFDIVFGLMYYYKAGVENRMLFGGSNWLAMLVEKLAGKMPVNTPAGIKALGVGFVLTVFWRLVAKLSVDLQKMLIGIYIFFIERKRIIPIKWYKKVLYCITFPFFDLVGRYAMYAALFMKVEWKPIPHESKVTIEEIESRNEEK